MFSLVAEPSLEGRRGADATPIVGPQWDAVLVAAQAGAPWAWTHLYRCVAASVLGMLRAAGDVTAEETLGDIFVEAARGLRTFCGNEAAFRLWLLSVAARELRRGCSARRRALTGLRSDGSLSPWAQTVLDELSDDEREVIVLRCIGRLTQAEVATLTRRPVPEVAALHRRAIVGLHLAVARQPLPTTGPWQLADRWCDVTAPATVDHAEGFLAAFAQVPAVAAAVERRHVASAAAAVTVAAPRIRQLRPAYVPQF